MIDEIKNKLLILAPSMIEVEDESALHAGHKGNGGGGHYKLNITSAKFNELSLVARHRMIYEALGDLIPNKIHALRIQANTTE